MSGKGGRILLWVLVLGIGVLSVLNYLNRPEDKQEKVAYVDLTKVFNEFEMKKELQGKLEGEIGEKKQVLDSLVFKLSIAKSNAEMPGAAEEVRWKYQQMQNYFFQEKKAYEGYSIAQTHNYDEQILKQMGQYISDYGDEKGFKLILGKNESGNVLYGDDPSDITEELIISINAKYQGTE
ncbi:MAG: OmpH family outer membrane protein [Flavobacteriales bacterium]|nr:OmpH family outer membrane protein [Flavobacteriales bacterium]